MADETTTIDLQLLTGSAQTGAGNLRALSAALADSTKKILDMSTSQVKMDVAFAKTREGFKAFKLDVESGLAAGSALFGQLQSNIMGFLNAASPAAMQTFTGSLQLLSGEIGRAFIPYLAEAVVKIQDAAAWVRNLDSATKGAIASKVMWGVAILAGVAALQKVYSIGVMVSQMLRGLYAAGILMLTNPWWAGMAVGLLALAAAVAALSGAFGGLRGLVGDAQAQIEALQALLKKLQEGGTLERKDLGVAFNADFQKQLYENRNDPKKLQEILGQARASLEKTVADNPQDLIDKQVLGARKAFADTTTSTDAPGLRRRKRLLYEMSGGDREDPVATDARARQAIKLLEQAGIDLNKRGAYNPEEMDRIEKVLRSPLVNAQAQLEALKALEKQGVPEAAMPKVALPKEMAPQNMALEGVRAAFQRSALGQGPLEQQILEQNRTAYAEFLKSLNRIGDNTDPNRKSGPIQ